MIYARVVAAPLQLLRNSPRRCESFRHWRKVPRPIGMAFQHTGVSMEAAAAALSPRKFHFCFVEYPSSSETKIVDNFLSSHRNTLLLCCACICPALAALQFSR